MMKKRFIVSLAILLIAVRANTQLQIVSASCENRINPPGVATDHIRFGWELASKESGQVQTAYQLVMASSKEKLEAGNYDVWNSSVVHSDVSIMVPYKGKSLKPAAVYYWRVRVWDKNKKVSEWSAVQQFITGIFSREDWANAKWIGYEDLPDSLRVAPGVHEPVIETVGNKAMDRSTVPLFRKAFNAGKQVKQAILFVSGLGQYEVSLNGIRAGNAFLAPGWTYFDKTVLYNTYDVTNLVRRGSNAIGAIVGNGFYNINRERYFKLACAFGFPKIICRLALTYTDGTVENIVSDERWKTTASAITFSSIYGGEDYDARLAQSGWNTASFNDASWKNALPVEAPAGKLLPEQDYPVAIMDSVNVKKIIKTNEGVYLYDFGQNLSGIVQLKLKGKRGQTVKLIPSELIGQNLQPNQNASGEPFYYVYTLGSDTEEIWQPEFTYYGFRYVEVTGAVPDSAGNNAGLPVITQLTSLHNRNASPVNGSFECSNDLFNRIYTLINWAIKSNMQSVITDCPHREKLSWLEQDYLMGNSIHYNFDIYHLYRQLVFDLMDAQYPQGFVPDIAPEFVVFAGGFLDSPEWGSSAVILPWLLYSWYGDKDIVQQAYPMMKKYVAYLESKSDHHILSHGLGDWFDYGPNDPGEAQLTPKAVTATAIYFYDVQLLAKMAEMLQYKTDAAKFARQAAAIQKAFNSKFFNDSTKVYATGSQTAMAMPLVVGLVADQNKKAVLQNLVDSIYAGNKALTAGDIGFHFLVKALDDGGASQLIFDMNNRDDVPGYGFQLKKGATALTESWPALENVSNNHLMLGHIMEWFYSGLAGISQEENAVAYKPIRIRPQPVGDINAAKGSFHSPYGWITTDWKKSNALFSMQVTIPVNTTANIYLPAGAKSMIYVNGVAMRTGSFKMQDGTAMIKAGSGKYYFEVKD